MSAEWMPVVRLPMTPEQFRQLPRSAAYQYEYSDGTALLAPRPKFYHALLDLPALAVSPGPEVPAGLELRPVLDADWEALVAVFAGAFDRQQPYCGLDGKARGEAARRALEFTRSGGDGPWVERASFVAVEQGNLAGAALVTLLPNSDPTDWRAYRWDEPPPEDCVARRLGRPHLTWVFVTPVFAGQGRGTALLRAAAQELLAMGYTQLASTFLSGNDSSLLWHWRNGFRLLAHPGSARRVHERDS
jgi:GNAT superfamily N-acetyltransferase